MSEPDAAALIAPEMPVWFGVFYYVTSFGLVPFALTYSWLWWVQVPWFFLVGPAIAIWFPWPTKHARARNPAPAAAGHETPSEAADGI